VTANNFTSSGVTITGGTINATSIGQSTPAAGSFTTLTSTQGTTLASTSGNVAIGNAGGTFRVISSNLNISTAGVVTLAGGQTADITTTAGSAPTALVFQPGNRTAATGTGAAFTLQA